MPTGYMNVCCPGHNIACTSSTIVPSLSSLMWGHGVGGGEIASSSSFWWHRWYHHAISIVVDTVVVVVVVAMLLTWWCTSDSTYFKLWQSHRSIPIVESNRSLRLCILWASHGQNKTGLIWAPFQPQFWFPKSVQGPLQSCQYLI